MEVFETLMEDFETVQCVFQRISMSWKVLKPDLEAFESIFMEGFETLRLWKVLKPKMEGN